MAYPRRKANRLEYYDYRQTGAYFITVCVQNREPILSKIFVESSEKVGASIARPSLSDRAPLPELLETGRIVERTILEIPTHYPGVTIGHYVIMPNHVHVLLHIGQFDWDTDRRMNGNREGRVSRRAMLAPTASTDLMDIPAPLDSVSKSVSVSEIVRQMKGYVSKQCGRPIWQKSYYDHIIRDERDYQTIWNYIDENPLRWCDDELFEESN